MKTLLRVCPLGAVLLLIPNQSVPALDIVLDVAGVGSVPITDNGSGDLANTTDGVIDFNETFSGQFHAEGRVQEASGVFGRSILISATPPATDAVFRNTDVVDRDFTLTVNRSPFPEGVGPPLGWSISYSGSAGDPTPDVVDIPAHSVTLDVPAVLLESVVGTAITLTDDIALYNSAVVVPGQATEMQAVFAFTAGPGDQILLPQDETFAATAIFVRVFNQEDRCIDKMNNKARQLVKKVAKEAEKCVKNVARGGGGPSTQCTTDLTSSKIDVAENRLLDSYVSSCGSIPLPAWGVCDTAPCISGAAIQAGKDLALDVFGGTALIGTAEVGNCQRFVVKHAGKVLAARWKEFRSCKRSNLSSITDDPSLVGTCLGPPQSDSAGNILDAEQDLASRVASKCISPGVVPVGSAFPGGVCSEELDGNFAACVSTRAACRVCLGINVADAIDPALDCDLFDDFSANASCP
jgi:hypothetical protein